MLKFLQKKKEMNRAKRFIKWISKSAVHLFQAVENFILKKWYGEIVYPHNYGVIKKLNYQGMLRGGFNNAMFFLFIKDTNSQ